MQQTQDQESLFGDVISRCTQEQGVEDGFLMDVSETAKEAGFLIPVHITHKVITLCESGNFKGILWDFLSMAMLSFRANKARNPNPNNSPVKYPFKLTVNGRLYNPIIAFNSYEGFTILFPEED